MTDRPDETVPSVPEDAPGIDPEIYESHLPDAGASPQAAPAKQKGPGVAFGAAAGRKAFTLAPPIGGWALLTRNEIVADVTRQVLDHVGKSPADAEPSALERLLVDSTNLAFAARNDAAVIKSSGKFLPILTLTASQTAEIMLRRHHVVAIQPSGKNTDPDFDLLAVYQDSGPDEGIYVTSLKIIRAIMRRYNSALTRKDAEEVIAVMEESAPRRQKCLDPDVIPVDNGLFNYRTKRLSGFDPKVIITSKARVALEVRNGRPIRPVNPVFDTPDGDQWDVESWMADLSDDEEIVALLWQVLGAIVRPHVRWSKSAWFYSESGNNGKGTLVELMRNLVGESSYVSLPIAEMGKDFALEGLTRATAILTDENDVGVYIDKAANLKAIVTNDVIAINRKFRTPVNYQFWGFMVQCLNEMPRIKDRSESIYRRQLFVPFLKCFTGVERPYIKNDYMRDPQVLQYVLWKVLVDLAPYDRLSEPAASKAVLDDYKEYNDPVRAFWNEFEHEFVWDFLPDTFLYDLYKEWFTKTNPSGSVLGMQVFRKDLWAVVEQSAVFETSDRRKQFRPAGRMDKPEPLIHRFQLEDWRNPNFSGPDPLKYSTFVPGSGARYRGIPRRTSIPAAAAMAAGIPPEAFAPPEED